MRISDWSSDVCSSDLRARHAAGDVAGGHRIGADFPRRADHRHGHAGGQRGGGLRRHAGAPAPGQEHSRGRSEEHTSELQSLMRISYAVFCLKKKNKTNTRKEVLSVITTQSHINCEETR